MSKRKIYISHSGADPTWVRAFADSLKSQGAVVWLADRELPGKPVQKAERALRTSDTIAFVVTRDYIRRPDLFFELGVALGSGKRAVPIVAQDLEAKLLPYPLRVRGPLPRESPEETARKVLAETAA